MLAELGLTLAGSKRREGDEFPRYGQWHRLHGARGARAPTFTNGWACTGAP